MNIKPSDTPPDLHRPDPAPFVAPPFSEPVSPARAWGAELREDQAAGSARASRLLNLLAVFIVGSGVGLSLAWWGSQPLPLLPQPTEDDTVPQLSAGASTRSESPDSGTDADKPAAVRWPAGELPYDGVPPTAGEPLLPRLPYRIETGEEMGESRSGAEPPATKQNAATHVAKSEAERADPAANKVKPSASAQGKPAGAQPAPVARPARSSASGDERRAGADQELRRMRALAEEELRRRRLQPGRDSD